jgi:hypothetical protein
MSRSTAPNRKRVSCRQERSALLVATSAHDRFRRRGLTGIHSLGVELRDGRWVARLKLRPDSDQVSVRETAAPVWVEAERVEAVRTMR